MSKEVEVILLAAGASSRMKGGDKTLELVEGIPLIRHLALEALASKAAQTTVILPPDKPLRQKALEDLPVKILIAREAHLGMAHSLKTAMQNLTETTQGALIVLSDMPEIKTGHLNRMIERFSWDNPEQILRAKDQNGKEGHPTLFGKGHFKALAMLTGDRGARDLLKTAQDHLEFVTFDDLAPTTDLDTPQEWAEWRGKEARKTEGR